MHLTVAQVADAVKKDQGYVRQHVHRRHLAARRRGGNVFIDLEDAQQWAVARGLEFQVPVEHASVEAKSDNRTARITALTLDCSTGRTRNLFTLIRHRREDSLGPWAKPFTGQWQSKELAAGLKMFCFDCSLQEALVVVEEIKRTGVLATDDLEIYYDLYPTVQQHWAFRDKRSSLDSPLSSPFSAHSADVTEYWSFDMELRDIWMELEKSSEGKLHQYLGRLGFPLHERMDRVGNLMIAGAQDAITCNLLHGPGQSLRFVVRDVKTLSSDTYRATVWGTFCGNEVARREFAVTSRQTSIQLSSTIDRVGFAVYRTSDGQCVDMMDTHLIMEFKGSIELDSKPTIHIQNRRHHTQHTFAPRGDSATFGVSAIDDGPELDQEIRRQWLDHRFIEREKRARKEGNLERFESHEFQDAIEHVVQLVRNHSSDSNEPIYLVDPHFELYLNQNKPEEAVRIQAYLKIFGAAYGRPIRILCTSGLDSGKQPWWSYFPALLTKHVCIRSFTNDRTIQTSKYSRAFHDRYLITSAGEYLMTSSFNGWQRNGVTIARLQYGVYGAEAERLWSINLNSTNEPYLVEEVS